MAVVAVEPIDVRPILDRLGKVDVLPLLFLLVDAGPVPPEVPLPDHILIRDGKQTMIHEIASFPIESNVSCVIEATGGMLTGETELHTNVYMNRTHFTSREKACYGWYPLTASYFIQNARLQIFITRRRYNSTKQKWLITRENVKINDDQVWSASLKFVSMH